MCPIIVHDFFLHFKNKGPYLFISKPIPCEYTPYFKKTTPGPLYIVIEEAFIQCHQKNVPMFPRFHNSVMLPECSIIFFPLQRENLTLKISNVFNETSFKLLPPLGRIPCR